MYKYQGFLRVINIHDIKKKTSMSFFEKHETLHINFKMTQIITVSTLPTLCKELTHWKRPHCWEGFGAGGEGDNRG